MWVASYHICHCVIGYVQTGHCSAQKSDLPMLSQLDVLPGETACNIGRNRDLAADAHPVAGCKPSVSTTMPESAVHISRCERYLFNTGPWVGV